MKILPIVAYRGATKEDPTFTFILLQRAFVLQMEKMSLCLSLIFNIMQIITISCEEIVIICITNGNSEQLHKSYTDEGSNLNNHPPIKISGMQKNKGHDTCCGVRGQI